MGEFCHRNDGGMLHGASKLYKLGVKFKNEIPSKLLLNLLVTYDLQTPTRQLFSPWEP